MTKIAVIGIGNVLLKDDGIAIYIINKLKNIISDNNIEIIDGGTSTLDMLKYFQENELVIIIDALKTGLKPGTIYKLGPDKINEKEYHNLSVHDIQIVDVVNIAKLMGHNPKVTIIGIEPKEIGYGIEISKELTDNQNIIINTIKEEISKFRNSKKSNSHYDNPK